MALNISSRNQTYCGNDSEIFLAPLLRWLIPVLVMAGILGNSMILIVLNSSKSMKTKPHILLSAMAAADLAHTIVAFVMNLYVYESLINSDSFSRIYHHVLKTPFLMLANWMSMTSTWLAVAVTIERLIAIRYPLKARFVMRKRIIVAAIAIIAVISFIASAYYLFWLRPIVYVSCQNPSKKLYRLYSDQRLWLYGHVSRKVHSALCALVPVVLLFAFNGSLVYHLHRNQALMRKFHDERNRSHHQDQMEVSEWPSNTNAGSNCNNNNSTPMNGDSTGQSVTATIRREYKVAVVVLAISLTSACCLLPSAALVVYDAARLAMHINTTPWWYFPAGDISNLLITAEKVLDFFLYCLTSGYFRRRLLLVMTNRRRSSTSTPKRVIHPRRPTLQKLMFLRRPTRGSGDSATSTTKHERRPSTSTISTFITSTTFRLRRSTASSDGSQKSPRLAQANGRFLSVVPGSEEEKTVLSDTQNV